ncbi:MAG: hypothetical protein ACREFT_04310, partial [Acetobacteraceae bacterium]
MTLLAELVATSSRVSGTPSRLAKVAEIAALLRKLSREEIVIGVSYLAGELPQGRIGVGYAAVGAAAEAAEAAREAASAAGAAGTATPLLDQARLSVGETDRRMTELGAIRGGGSAARRSAALGELFSRATAEERTFLVRLLAGELRQGALAGVMVDAVAAASAVPIAEVRRAAMYCGSLG